MAILPMSKKSNKGANNRQSARDDPLFLNNIAPPYTNKHNFTYPDAHALAELLLEQSQKCSLFKPEGLRRARYVGRNLSVNCISKETIAPTSTPDSTFLSREDSAKSGDIEDERMEIARNGSDLSLAQTWSTVAECVEGPYDPPATKATPLLKKKTRKPKINAEPKSAALPRNYSFPLGAHVHQVKNWTQNILKDICRPLRRPKTREGKRPAVELPHGLLSTPPPKPLSRHLSDPSSSGQFPWLKEQGGNGPPKGLSALTLDRLDAIEKEQARLIGTFEKLEKLKREILFKANEERRNRKV